MPGALEELRQAIVDGDDDTARALASEALRSGVPARQMLDLGIVAAIQEAGDLWDRNEYFLPEVILSAGAFKAALEVVEPHLTGDGDSSAGRVLFGVVKGDVHDLGKNIVIAFLTGAGFEVIDLGVDVPVETFVDKVEELRPDIVALGAYMTTTMLLMKEIVSQLTARDLRGGVKILVGGAPTSEVFATQIGADAWGKDAFDAVGKARRLAGRE